MKVTCPDCHERFKDADGLEQHRAAKHAPLPVSHPSPSSSSVKYIIGGLLIALFLYFSYVFIFPHSPLDSFAQCVSERGAVMYGAFWCSHCLEQKKEFGTAFRHIEYVECSTPDKRDQTALCKQLAIDGYPTWIFADGSRTGQLSLQALSEKTGCLLP